MDNCIFCKIVRAEAPADIVYENEDLLAFRDINPQAPTHVLVVTKKHFQHLDELPPMICSWQENTINIKEVTRS